MKFAIKQSILVLFATLLFQLAFGSGKPLIFPIPSEIQINEGIFLLDEHTFFVSSETMKNEDKFLTEFFRTEMADKYEYSIKISRKKNLPGKFILIGSIANPLVKNYCIEHGLLESIRQLGNEGYILSVTEKTVVVAANTKQGALYGFESLRQIIQKKKGQVSIAQVLVKDSPHYPFRGIKLYLPGKENIQFFKRFIKDFVALYKFNKIILELNANMRLVRHPELNIGAVQFARHLNYSRLDRPPGVHMEYQNSSHQDNADGQILEKEEVADLVRYMRNFNIEVIPELPSLTHSYYLLAGHEELAENLNQPYPDTYCPQKLAIYKIYFDVLDEYIDVIHPKIIHVGHDEWRMEKDICELCRGKDYGELYARDLKKIHDHLAAKGIKTAIWGDHLLESVTEKDHQTWKSSTGYQYKIPGALRPDQVQKLLPKDIIVFNWFWDNIENDRQVSKFGFQQVYGNLRADISSWDARDKIKGLLGGAPSSWAATTEYNIGKDQLTDFLGAANLLWSRRYLEEGQLAIATEPLVSDAYKNLSGRDLAVDNGAPVKTIDISSQFNSSLQEIFSGDYDLVKGNIKVDDKLFHLTNPGNKSAIVVSKELRQDGAIEINKDASSILFLHACGKEALNNKAYASIYDFDDTADPLGYYEVLYEDSLVLTIPIRYGVNILDWKWKQRMMSNEKEKGKYSQNKYAYKAAAVECSMDSSKSVSFFSFEWQNPRFGKKISEIRLRPVNYKKGAGNEIILLALSISENQSQIAAKGTEAQ